MSEKKISWDELMNMFDEFESNFVKDSSDPKLLEVFKNFSDIFIKSGFNDEQKLQIIQRINHLRELFASKMEELKNMSLEALNKKTQLARYLKNANYKTKMN